MNTRNYNLTVKIGLCYWLPALSIPLLCYTASIFQIRFHFFEWIGSSPLGAFIGPFVTPFAIGPLILPLIVLSVLDLTSNDPLMLSLSIFFAIVLAWPLLVLLKPFRRFIEIAVIYTIIHFLIYFIGVVLACMFWGILFSDIS